MALRSYADGAVFAEAFGKGPPRVLALHGWGRRGADFKRSLGEIPALALDLPGFGASPPPSEVLGAEGYADIVADVLDEFDRPPVLVGHSFGGRVAVCLGAQMPSQVGPLLLTAAPVMRVHGARKPPIGFRVMRSLNRMNIVSDERMEAMRRRRGSSDYQAATGVMRDVLVKAVNESYEQQLRDIQSSVLLLWGDQDREVPVAVARMAVEVIRQTGDNAAELQVLEGVGHHVPVEAPDELRLAVEALLE